MQENSRGSENRERETNGSKGNTSKRGFASMNPELQRQIAREGGKAAHQKGVAHEFNSDEARKAGRKGGEAVSANREHMSAIGKKGGEASRESRRQNKSR
jgi:general stress protein YciG